MKKNGWFNWVIILVLIAMAALTVRQAVGTVQVVSANSNAAGLTNAKNATDANQCPFTDEQIRSIHAEFIDSIGHNLPFTKDGPTGVEGGMSMLSHCQTP
jgi:hypothetical protein